MQTGDYLSPFFSVSFSVWLPPLVYDAHLCKPHLMGCAGLVAFLSFFVSALLPPFVSTSLSPCAALVLSSFMSSLLFPPVCTSLPPFCISSLMSPFVSWLLSPPAN